MDENKLRSLAAQHGFSPDAVRHLYGSLQTGRGTMAKFNHPELGGPGQWMRGGMLMIGDMFNHGLKARVDALCNDLCPLLPESSSQGASQTSPSSPPSAASAGGTGFAPYAPFAPPAAAWWPEELGHPSAVGGQNDLHYAYFRAADRLAVRYEDTLRIFDTTGHAITGFSQQQQTGIQGLHCVTHRGLVPVLSLRVETTGTPRST